MAKVNLSFEINELAQATSSQIEQALNNFEATIARTLPQDYRLHMKQYNGGDVVEDKIENKDYTEDGGGIACFYPVGYGDYTIEEVHTIMTNNDMLPSGYIPIGITTGGGKIIMSLNNDATYGSCKESYPDGTIRPLSPSFTDLINDMVERVG